MVFRIFKSSLNILSSILFHIEHHKNEESLKFMFLFIFVNLLLTNLILVFNLPARWLSANALGLRSRGPGFESRLGYGCLVAFFMYYRDGSSRLDTIVWETMASRCYLSWVRVSAAADGNVAGNGCCEVVCVYVCPGWVVEQL